VLAPCEVAHLAARIDVLHWLPGEGVPESDAAVGGAPSARQQPVVMRGPRDGWKIKTILVNIP